MSLNRKLTEVKETVEWNCFIEQMFHGMYYPECTLFSSAHETLHRIYHLKQVLTIFTVEIISSIFSNYKTIKLKIDNKNSRNCISSWKLGDCF
jgi:hypothetical protein